jgi:uncharacterized membrane protein
MKVKLMRIGMLPLRRLKISINDNSLTLKGNESKELDLPKGDYTVTMKMDWWKSSHQISVYPNETTIEISHYLPDIFYIVGVLVTIILAVISFALTISVLYLSIWVFVFILIQVYYFLVKRNQYFSINTE